MTTDPKPPRPLDFGDIEIVLSRDSPELADILRRIAADQPPVFKFAVADVWMDGDGSSCGATAKLTLRFVGTEPPTVLPEEP